MKKRFFTFLTAVALLVTLTQPALLQGHAHVAGRGVTPNGDCHNGHICGS